MPAYIRLVHAILIASLATLPTAADQPHRPSQSASSAHRTSSNGPSRLAQAAEITSSKGFSASLPPHISTLLRLTTERESPVKQNAIRNGSVVQGFDVSVANKNDIILFVVDESSHDQTLYLTSPDGTLHRVVQVKSGVGSEIRITDKEKKAFTEEMKFWLDRLVPATKPK